MSTEISLDDLGLSILNVPQELKTNMLWAVSSMKVLDAKTGRLDKSPRNPRTGDRLSVTDKTGWVTFEEAVNSGYPALGMLLTADDPYTVIDLDKSPDMDANIRARSIFDAFETYAEKSFSGKGVHMVLLGQNQAGRRKGNVEVYSQERYIICTGKVLKNLPIIEDRKKIESLILSLNLSDNPDTLPIINDSDERESDSQILKRMFQAQNGDAVRELYENFPSANDDHSQLDSRLAQHICFYTKNHQQALRLFRGSKLYRGEGSVRKKSGYERTDKYEEDYLIRRTFSRAWWLIAKRAEEAKMSDESFNNLMATSQKYITTEGTQCDENGEVIPSPTIHPTADDSQLNGESFLPAISRPTGLVGDIADFVYNAAPRPVWEIAIAAAISLVAAMAGRHYNISGSGLGLYSVILAKTGRGKEAANSGISSLLAHVSTNMPSINMFRGPSSIASGQGLIRAMGETNEEDNIPSKLLLLSEFGYTLSIITNRDATAADVRTRQALLDFYSKNAWGGFITESAYADKANNTKSVTAPNLTILGDTTPDTFFKSISMDIIADGFLPRFLIIEYDGLRKKANYNAVRIPSHDLLAKIQTLAHQVISMRDQNSCFQIPVDEAAHKILDDFDTFCDAKINSDSREGEIWNRVHLNALRLAGVLAVGNNTFSPIVTKDEAEWAIALIKRSVLSITHRIDNGTFGKGDIQLDSLLRQQIKAYISTPVRLNSRMEPATLNDKYKSQGIVTHKVLIDMVKDLPAFANSARGVNMTLNGSLQSLIAQGDLTEMNMKEIEMLDKRVLRGSRAYTLGDYFKGLQDDSHELTDEEKQEIKDLMYASAVDKIKAYFGKTFVFDESKPMIVQHRHGVMSYNTMYQTFRELSVFRNSNAGTANAVAYIVNLLIDDRFIEEVDLKEERYAKENLRCTRAYRLVRGDGDQSGPDTSGLSS